VNVIHVSPRYTSVLSAFTLGGIVRDAGLIVEQPLSLRMVKRLHEALKISYESLLAEVS
jgi:hypothetical protein